MIWSQERIFREYLKISDPSVSNGTNIRFYLNREIFFSTRSINRNKIR